MAAADTDAYTEYRQSLGREMKRIRTSQGYSIERLAEYAGLHKNTIGSIERGAHDIKLVTNARIMSALGCEVFDIGETAFVYHLEELADYPTLEEVMLLPPSSIVSMTGGTIRNSRIAKGMSIMRLASVTGIHYNTIWNIENGLVEATLYNLYKIHRGLALSTLKGSIEGLQVLS